jgi:hypothetical protein
LVATFAVALVLVACFAAPGGSAAAQSSHRAGVRAVYAAESISRDGAISLDGAQGPEATSTEPVYFNETGLPGGAAWLVVCGGNPHISTGPIITFSEASGQYQFYVGPVVTVKGTYAPTPSGGTLTVASIAANKTITFSPLGPPFEWSATFTETGLPSGTAWSVTVAGSTWFSLTNSIVVPLNNGSFPFGIGTVATWTPSPSTGTIDMDGRNVAEAVKFTTPTVLGLPPAEGYAAISVGLTLLLAAFAVLVLMFRQRRIRKERREAAATAAPAVPGPPTATEAAPPTQPPPPPPPTSPQT